MRTKRWIIVMCGRVRRIQGESFREDLEQAGVVGFGMLEHRGVRLQQDVNGGHAAGLESQGQCCGFRLQSPVGGTPLARSAANSALAASRSARNVGSACSRATVAAPMKRPQTTSLYQ